MVKPATLWSRFKDCPDSKWLGDICRALGGQQVDLDFGQKQMLESILQDSEWMDERMDEQRKRWAERKRKSRESLKSPNVTQCHGDIGDIHDVTIHPSVRPSVHPSINTLSNERVNAHGDRPDVCPTDDELRQYAKQIAVGEDYIPVFVEEMTAKGWEYLNPSGVMVKLNRRNAKAILGSFFRQWQKSRSSRQGESTEIRRPDYKPVFKKAGE